MKMKLTIFLICIGLIQIQSYDGDGTYYGNGGAGESGSCLLRRFFNGIGITVAINQEQYDNGSVCGKCIVIRGEGIGSGMRPIIGPIYATIDNVCPECKYGDIDLGLEGDGRFRIHWDFIKCSDIPSRYRKKLRL